ncbi:PREDICTED: ubiquitin domain-containing protein DSK2a-like [Tarenaya hassleriana]|uniref:ubiquitin domain-containing protein DSK2a-like n=1 Tax=Tarenaya hassleriana TaxID=28532 RepID=UPI00053C9B5F|nr:PREDICTED: ubiquitin domain-containing protein DSK2a-like [Tarenaya hassleriana]
MGGGEGGVGDSSVHDDAAAEELGRSGGEVSVNIRCSNGSKFSVQVKLDSTVGSFKSVLAQKCDIPADQQRLIYKGRILKDDQTLVSYGLEDDHTVHLVRGFATSSASNGSPNPTVAAPNPTQNNTSSVGSDDSGSLGGSGLGASLFPGLGLGGNGGFFATGLPDFEQVQQQLSRNPDIMREMMNMPVVQSLMNNPEVMRNMIMNNPQMRQIIDSNPELAHVLNDPSILRQTLDAARNPELMREMMRNTDRAMSNIEATPEGFNMLRRMYENVQEPLLNATTGAGTTGTDATNPFASLLGTQLRDGSTNQPATASENSDNSPAPNANPLPNPWASTGNTGRASQTNTTGSDTAREDMPRSPAGLGGGLPGLDNMFGAMPDANLLSQLMQNPAVNQMMQSLLSNPQYMNQILNLNPQLRGMLDSNTQLREMLQSPDLLRRMTSPDTLQQLLTFQQSLLSQLGRQQPTQEETGGAGGATAPGSGPGLEMLLNMFGGLGSGGLAGPQRPNGPPEELYATQLSQLQEMGFFDTGENVRALVATAGNVHAAVERLLGNPPPPGP